jgi:hypothetical protein
MSQLSPGPTTPPTVTTLPSLKDVLWERWARLLIVKRRLYFLKAFERELLRVTRGKTFSARNDVIWHMVLDSRDKCVIDLCSATVEMGHGVGDAKKVKRDQHYQAPPGLFKLLRDHYRAQLSRVYAGSKGSELDGRIAPARAAIFHKLFPDAVGNVPSAADIEAIAYRLFQRTGNLRNDRNKHRAHVYESLAGTAKMHSTQDLDDLFAYCEGLISDLAAVGLRESFGGGDMNNANVDETATDLIELILFGHADDVAVLFRDRSREDVYAELHTLDAAEHPKPQAYENVHFNDRQYGLKFSQAL